jgi:regulator of RNase E activity RraB
MTDDWDFYFLRVADKAASIYVDLGAHETAPNPNLPYMAYIRLHMNAPRDDGLVTIEDSLKAALVNGSTDYVGRCTTNSCRDFFFYVATPTEWSSRVASCMSLFASYKYEADTREEREWSSYLEYLYPSDGDRQRIENRRVCDALERNGDKLTVAREIDHWAYFSSQETLNAYVAEAIQLGFNVREVFPPDANDERHCARVWRSDVPAYHSIDDVALPLFNLAAAHGGEYDGWESVVVT